ncbi:tetratricopeptide repeat protein [Vibrio paracholerae]|uniref:tetratricopeptide repeat protein n=1 Tax=Vibrio paracholerae TaxID=650003 RepID=UPI002094A397|nr:tetratricopeptide repeat protein [Vibrio paracholerae]MCO7016131.1 tetratricopeptide repeat protein [Vibrio paracholerae]
MSSLDQRFLLFTGFHRSATSATANYLLNAGLDMGMNLMQNHISNAKGHFEDWPVVHLHDEQLSKHNTTWQFHDECVLSPAPDFLDAYIEDRIQISSYWGVKDPRACLFLNEWYRALGKRGAFLFVIRHWSSSIESLLHRHSRELAYALVPLNVASADFNFWTHPALAAKMWLSYNKRILDFAKTNPEQSLIVTQRALFEGAPIIESLNRQFGFELNEGAESPFDPSLLRDKASSLIFSNLSDSLQAQLNEVWLELLDLAKYKSDNELPIINDDKIDESVLTSIYNNIAANTDFCLYGQAASLPSHKVFDVWLDAFLDIVEPAKAVDYLDTTRRLSMICSDHSEWLAVLDDKYSLEGPVLLAAAKLLMRLNEYHFAITYFQKSIAVGYYFPFISMMLGQCYQSLELFNEAEFFFNKAISENPNNPIFYTNYAKFLLAINRVEKAEEKFVLGYKKGSHQPNVVIPYIEYLESKDLDKAISIAERVNNETPTITVAQVLNRLRLRQDVEQGLRQYNDSVTMRLKGKDKMGWLVKSCYLIDSKVQERDFILRCLGHWNQLND